MEAERKHRCVVVAVALAELGKDEPHKMAYTRTCKGRKDVKPTRELPLPLLLLLLLTVLWALRHFSCRRWVGSVLPASQMRLAQKSCTAGQLCKNNYASHAKKAQEHKNASR